MMTLNSQNLKRTIYDSDGTHPRSVTLAQYLAEVRAAVVAVKPVADAFYRGDHDACALAQAQARRQITERATR